MALDKQGNFSQQPSELPDVPSPSMTPDQIRAKWQTPLDEFKTTFNNAIDKLNSTTDGASGADNVGATGFDGTPSTTQALLETLNTNKATKGADWTGTWQGYTPSKADPGISSVVEQHTAQLADIMYLLWNPTSGTDITSAFQAALDMLEAKGGGNLKLPRGTFYISMANSNHPNACIQLPSNVSVYGYGKETIIQRLPSERNVNGVLFVNKGYDTQGGITAGGNFELNNFTISDGDVSASPRQYGDLLGFCHGHDITLKNMIFGNHDQHALDIASCDNVKVYDCTFSNAESNGFNEVIQIDGSSVLGVWGAYVDVTPCSNLYFKGNKIQQLGSASTILLNHAANTTYSNITFEDNWIDGGYFANNNVIQIDDTSDSVTIENLILTNNRIFGNHPDAKIVNLFSDKTNSVFKKFTLTNNFILGKGRIGLWVGCDTLVTALPQWSNIVIDNNQIHIDATGSSSTTPNALVLHGMESSDCGNNKISLTRTNKVDSAVCLLDGVRQLDFHNNSVRAIYTSGSNTTASAVEIRNRLSSYLNMRLDVHDNDLFGDSVNYNIYSGSLTTNDRVKVHHNNFVGADPSTAHIYEVMAISDGTNGWHKLNLGGTNGSMNIASGQFYQNISMSLKKTGNSTYLSKAKIELQYAPTSALDTDAEEIQCAYLSSTSFVGTQVCDVNQTVGTFSILTGVSGVSVVINNTTFQPAIRTAGVIQVYCGI